MTDALLPLVPLALLVLAGCAADPGIEAPAPRSPVAPSRGSAERPRPPRTAGAARSYSDVAPLVGLVASDDPTVTAALADGVRLAFAEARAADGPALSLLVGEHETQWASGAASAVRMAVDQGAVAVIAPPERRRAHEIAQFGTRAGVPVVSTSPAASVTQAGSTWVVSVVRATASSIDSPPTAPALDARASEPFATRFRATHGRPPDGWNAAGYDAGRALVEAVRRHGLRRDGLTSALSAGEPFAGASGAVRIDATGARRGP